jgi:hypothetical protein
MLLLLSVAVAAWEPRGVYGAEYGASAAVSRGKYGKEGDIYNHSRGIIARRQYYLSFRGHNHYGVGEHHKGKGKGCSILAYWTRYAKKMRRGMEDLLAYLRTSTILTLYSPHTGYRLGIVTCGQQTDIPLRTSTWSQCLMIERHGMVTSQIIVLGDLDAPGPSLR